MCSLFLMCSLSLTCFMPSMCSLPLMSLCLRCALCPRCAHWLLSSLWIRRALWLQYALRLPSFLCFDMLFGSGVLSVHVNIHKVMSECLKRLLDKSFFLVSARETFLFLCVTLVADVGLVLIDMIKTVPRQITPYFN